MDVNQDNQIGFDEFRHVMLNEPFACQLLGDFSLALDLDDPDAFDIDVRKIFDQVDHSGDGEVDFEEIVDYLRTRFEDHLPDVLRKFRNSKMSESPHPSRFSKSLNGCINSPQLDDAAWAGPEIPSESLTRSANVSAGAIPDPNCL
jgi:hypothetical protein